MIASLIEHFISCETPHAKILLSAFLSMLLSSKFHSTYIRYHIMPWYILKHYIHHSLYYILYHSKHPSIIEHSITFPAPKFKHQQFLPKQRCQVSHINNQFAGINFYFSYLLFCCCGKTNKKTSGIKTNIQKKGCIWLVYANHWRNTEHVLSYESECRNWGRE